MDTHISLSPLSLPVGHVYSDTNLVVWHSDVGLGQSVRFSSQSSLWSKMGKPVKVCTFKPNNDYH